MEEKNWKGATGYLTRRQHKFDRKAGKRIMPPEPAGQRKNTIQISKIKCAARRTLVRQNRAVILRIEPTAPQPACGNFVIVVLTNDFEMDNLTNRSPD